MTIREGDKVAVDYEGRFEDGTVFDGSAHGTHSHPLVFTVGQHQVIRGFEGGVIGMNEGESKTVTLTPKDAYGERDERLMRTMPRTELKLPNNQEIKEGMALMTYTPEGQPIQIFVKEVTKENVVLDLNHPLAGKTLVFDVTILGINETIKPEHERQGH